MNNKGQMAATEFIVIICLLLICLGEGWYIVTKKTDMTVYQSGSKPKVTPIEVHPGFFGCANVRVMEMMDGKNIPIGNGNNTNRKP